MKKKILIVEDNLPIAETLRAYVEQDGFEAVTVEYYIDAQTALKKERFDLVLLDLNLPDRAGLDILKSECAKPVKPPFIVVTGDKDVDLIMECISIGAADFITKPVSYQRLSVSIKNALDNKPKPFKITPDGFKRRVKENIEKFKDEEEKIEVAAANNKLYLIDTSDTNVIFLPTRIEEVKPMIQYQLTLILATLKVCKGDVVKTRQLLNITPEKMDTFMQMINNKKAKA